MISLACLGGFVRASRVADGGAGDRREAVVEIPSLRMVT